MKITTEDLQELVEILQKIDAFKPLIKLASEKIIDVGADLKPLIEKFSAAMIDLRINAFNQCIDAGFSRDEALAITCDHIQGTRKAFLDAARSNK